MSGGEGTKCKSGLKYIKIELKYFITIRIKVESGEIFDRFVVIEEVLLVLLLTEDNNAFLCLCLCLSLSTHTHTHTHTHRERERELPINLTEFHTK